MGAWRDGASHRFDLELRRMDGARQQIDVVLQRQHVFENSQLFQGESPVANESSDDRKFRKEARHAVATVGGSIRQAKVVPAVDEQRGAALRQIQPPCVDLCEGRDQSHGRRALGRGESGDFRQELRSTASRVTEVQCS